MSNITGRTRFRANWRGLMVLQVEVVDKGDGYGGDMRQFWRDATVEDLCEIQHLTYSRIDVLLPTPEERGAPGGRNGPGSTH